MSLLRRLYYTLPLKARFLIRRVWYSPTSLLGRTEIVNSIRIPPKSIVYTGGGDFVKIGYAQLDRFLKLDLIHKDSCVLDIGSGMGRIAIPLTGFLSASGCYFGFDIVQSGITWCHRNISTKYPNFHFQYVDIRNDLYSISGIDASNFRFPYPENMFDFTFLISVFTHMLPNEIENYFAQIHRVLKSGAFCYSTFFCFNDEDVVDGKIDAGLDFGVDLGHYRLDDDRVRHANVCFKQSFLMNSLNANGFQVTHIIPGTWRLKHQEKTSGSLVDFQDIIVFKKI